MYNKISSQYEKYNIDNLMGIIETGNDTNNLFDTNLELNVFKKLFCGEDNIFDNIFSKYLNHYSILDNEEEYFNKFVKYFCHYNLIARIPLLEILLYFKIDPNNDYMFSSEETRSYLKKSTNSIVNNNHNRVSQGSNSNRENLRL